MRFLVLMLLASCAAAPGPGGFDERLLGTVPEDAHLHGLAVFSEDGRHVAYVEQAAGGNRAVCGAWKSRPFHLVC